MGRLYDPANVQQTYRKCIQNTHANAGRLLDRVNTLLGFSIRDVIAKHVIVSADSQRVYIARKKIRHPNIESLYRRFIIKLLIL